MDKDNNKIQLLEEYLNYLLVIKGRSNNTAIEYKTDITMFLKFVIEQKNQNYKLNDIDINFIKSITLNDMYAFISYCQTNRKSCAGTRSRKIVSIRQFWKYLKTKAHLLENNIAEELETPKMSKRIPKYLTLEQSVRLLIECENHPRDRCIITIFLNCALRLSELVSINVEQVNNEVISVIGKGNKERKIFLTPATKKAITDWLEVRKKITPNSNALFITSKGTRIRPRTVQDIIKKYIKKAGLDSKSLSCHKLRHTSATLMYQYGKTDVRSLQQILGHESIATTEIYTHVSNEQLERAVNSNPLSSMFGEK